MKLRLKNPVHILNDKLQCLMPIIISKEEYDRWRYTYPEVEVQRTRDALDELRNTKKAEQ